MLLSIRKRLLSAPNVWVESTERANKEPGSPYDLGKVLWSPTRYGDGKDRYAIMRQPRPSDEVLHFVTDKWSDGITDKRIAGISAVAGTVEETGEEPPRAGQWAGRSSYYRIALTDYLPLQPVLPVRELEHAYTNEIVSEIIDDRPRYYPFSRYREGVRLAQGAYLSRATPRLVQLVLSAMGIEASAGLSAAPAPEDHKMLHEEFAEGQRRRREAYFFARHPDLARAAKAHYGFRCMVCRFDFELTYGELGRGYIECHHLNPLSERAEADWTDELVTRLDDVAVVCANCHRMLHRQRPALAPLDLRDRLKIQGP